MKIGWVQNGKDRYYFGSNGAIASVILDVPLIAQNPELPRGCEVTSLAMMLQDAGIKVDKMTLARQVKKDPTPYSKQNGQIYFGNPNTGFVGDMYSFKNSGLAVYHGPIAELAKKYLPNRIVDFSGSKFEEIYKYLNSGTPVWVINNTWFDTVPSQYWQQWNTPAGRISITYKEHSVLITGYDKDYIYFNDPLTVIKNRKIPVSAFKRGWEQMGKQAISY
ncbi:MAG: C39 family peptidase, partial [Neobacillus sp.]